MRGSRPSPALAPKVGLLLLLAAVPAGAGLPANFGDELLAGASSLTQPVGLAFLPDGRILVVEQTSGIVRLVVGATVVPVGTVPDLNTTGAEQGLLGVAVDPGWPARPYVYFHTTRSGNVIVISRFTASGDLSDGTSTNLGMGDEYLILTDAPDIRIYHNGGTVRFGPDGMLYASVGDDGDPCQAQELSMLHGKILRLDVSGLPAGPGGPPDKSLITPADNPFAGQGANAGLVFALGFRNPYRFTIDPLTGRLYVADVGQDDWEEVDEVVAGDNLGWPFREGPVVRTLHLCSEPGGSGSQPYKGPIAWYPHAGEGSQAVVGGLMYRHVSGGSRNYPFLYDGAVFYGDFSAAFFRLVKRTFTGSWEPLPVPGQADSVNWATGLLGAADMLVGPDGAIYYAKLLGWQLRRIVYTGPPVTGVPDRGPDPPLSLRAYPNPLRRGGRVVLRGHALPHGPLVVEIFDASGRPARSAFPARPDPQGLVFQGGDLTGTGSPLAPGVYFLRVSGTDGMATGRLVVLP